MSQITYSANRMMSKRLNRYEINLSYIRSTDLTSGATLHVLWSFFCKFFEQATLAKCVQTFRNGMSLSKIALTQRTNQVSIQILHKKSALLHICNQHRHIHRYQYQKFPDSLAKIYGGFFWWDQSCILWSNDKLSGMMIDYFATL